MNQTRTELILGEDNLTILKNSHVAVFGLGGVGGYCAEMLVRTGVGKISLIDFDIVDESNINRQIIALTSTIGQKKVDLLKKRLQDINPNCEIFVYDLLVDENSIDKINFSLFDAVIDCIDMVKSKVLIIQKAIANNDIILSSMGTARRVDPSKLMVTKIDKTYLCPLAKAVRGELRKLGIKDVKVVFSTEEAYDTGKDLGSLAFVPASAGILLAKECIFDILKKNQERDSLLN